MKVIITSTSFQVNMAILWLTNSDVKLKGMHQLYNVTVLLRKGYVALCHPKMNLHIKWNSHLKEYKRYAPDTIILKTRSEVKVKLNQKCYVTPCHPKMHLHT